MTWELRPDEGKIALPRLQSNYSPQTVPVPFPPGLPQGRRGFVGDDSAGDFSLVPSTGPLDPSKRGPSAMLTTADIAGTQSAFAKNARFFCTLCIGQSRCRPAAGPGAVTLVDGPNVSRGSRP